MFIPVYDAKNRLSALLADVERGVEITITRRGVPVARLVPAGPAFDQAAARSAADGLLAASQGLTLGDIRIKDLVDEGRR